MVFSPHQRINWSFWREGPPWVLKTNSGNHFCNLLGSILVKPSRFKVSSEQFDGKIMWQHLPRHQSLWLGRRSSMTNRWVTVTSHRITDRCPRRRDQRAFDDTIVPWCCNRREKKTYICPRLIATPYCPLLKGVIRVAEQNLVNYNFSCAVELCLQSRGLFACLLSGMCSGCILDALWSGVEWSVYSDV